MKSGFYFIQVCFNFFICRSVTASDVDEFLSYSPSSLRLDSDTDDAISSFLKYSAEEKEDTVAHCADLCILDDDTSGTKKSTSVTLWKDLCETTNLSSSDVICTTCNVMFASLEAVSRHMCNGNNAVLFSDEDGSSLGSFSSSSYEEEVKSETNQAVWKDICVTSPSMKCDEDKMLWKNINDVTDDDDQSSEQLMCAACHLVFVSIAKLENHICVEQGLSVSDEDGSSLASFSSTDDDCIDKPLWKDVCLTVVDKDNNNVIDTLKSESPMSEVGHCSVCKLVFSTPEKLEAHKQKFAAKFACCHCSKRFANTSKLRIHHRKHSKEKPFQCHCCGKYYTHRTTLVRHQQIYCTPLREKAEGRGADEEIVREIVFEKDEDKMAKMILDAIGKGAKPAKNSKLKTTKEVANAKSGSTSCKICDSEFFDTQSLDNHRQYHLQQRTCCQCQRVMGNKSKLLIHHRSHTKELPYACSVCDRSFAERSTLTKHVATHGERNFRCDLCDKAFVRKDYLAKHVLTHRQTYKCSQCSFVCYNRLDIEQHVAEHPSV